MKTMSAMPSPRVAMPDESPSTTTVRIDVELLRQMQLICARTPGRNGKQLKVVDYLDSLVRKAVNARHEEVLEEIAAEQAAKKKK